MKKVILSLALAAGISATASAQATIGVKAGVNLSNVSGDGSGDAKNIVGFNAGLMADISFSDLLSFHPELLYSQKGAKLESGNIKLQQRTGYLDVPLLLRVKADGLFFEAGPQVGFLINQKNEYTNYPFLGTGSNTSTDGTRKVDIGYIAGLGYRLEQGLEFGVRYNGGISDLSDPSGGAKTRNSVFQFQVGYSFGGN
ncbi:porin family protein [Hymenobacter convexus]|uniref:porin family protein n=1 Tax=Hymenobacter sp. CA1UV-4 TaxID=3063782 RepID=UPI002713E6E9|nr:porin family protein [Hymenobacter sp. CA1UV-4]MDO7854021.1 porin family protein [Hymenobacter sp. CA1UV-4]